MRAFELALIKAHNPGQESAGLEPGDGRGGTGRAGARWRGKPPINSCASLSVGTCEFKLIKELSSPSGPGTGSKKRRSRIRSRSRNREKKNAKRQKLMSAFRRRCYRRWLALFMPFVWARRLCYLGLSGAHPFRLVLHSFRFNLHSTITHMWSR